MNEQNNFFKDEEGATAVEYAILASAIAAIIVTVVYSIGTKTNNAFNALETILK